MAATALQPRRFATIDHNDVLQLLKIFDDLDVDGDGAVSQAEFVAKLKYCMGARAERVFSAMDAVRG